MSVYKKILINSLEAFVDINNENGDILLHWIINNVYKYYDVRQMNIDVKRKRMQYEAAKVSNEIVDLGTFDYNQDRPNYEDINVKIISTEIQRQIVEIDLYSILSDSIVLNSSVTTQGGASIEEIWRIEPDWTQFVQEQIVFATDQIIIPAVRVDTNEAFEIYDPIQIRQPFYMEFDVTEPSTAGSTDGSIEVTNQWGGPSPYEYRIQEGIAGTSGITTPWQSSAIFGNLAAGSYSVQMKDSLDNESIPREVIVPDSDTPQIPTALNATAITINSFDANWQEVVADAYTVEVTTASTSGGSQIVNILAPASTVTIENLAPTTLYSYVVRSVIGGQESADSNSIDVTTL